MRLAIVAFAVLATAACGGEGASEEPAGGFSADLRILSEPAGPGRPEVDVTLTCGPPGGTHPDPEAACAALERNVDALAPVDEGVACTQEYGGSARAIVRGSAGGADVNASFSHANGCEIDRWDRLAPLLDPGA